VMRRSLAWLCIGFLALLIVAGIVDLLAGR